MTIERPYFDLTTSELVKVVERHSSDVRVLAQILVELMYRQRKAALNLREMVVERLRNLLPNEYFSWPETEADPGNGTMDDAYFSHQQGLLGFLGYRVGHSGIDVTKRQALLDFVMSHELPKINSREYMLAWGAPHSAQRLKKMAESIAAFARNARQRINGNLTVAISEWEADLFYLKVTYYVGRFDFPWPLILK